MPADVVTPRRILIEVRDADPLAVEGDGLLVPTLSDGSMVEGLATRVKQVGGKVVEDEARRSAPIAVGAAVMTGGGALPVARVIHAPIAEVPGMKIGVESIRRATRAGLLAANHFQLARLVVPGFGYGEVGVPLDEAARAIIDEVRAFRGLFPTAVILVDLSAEMVEAFHIELGER